MTVLTATIHRGSIRSLRLCLNIQQRANIQTPTSRQRHWITRSPACSVQWFSTTTKSPPASVGDTIARVKSEALPRLLDLEKVRTEILNYWIQQEASSGNGHNLRSRYCCFTYDDAKRAYLQPSATWHWLDRELSSNVAGETGAVHIYKGALAALQVRSLPQQKDVLAFCQEHMENESKHLRLFQMVVPDFHKHTKLLPIWRMAGFLLGFFPTLMGGSQALVVTVEAVETFVEEHFQEQIQPLKEQQRTPELVRLLESCCEDEVHHKEDAAKRLLDGNENVIATAWWVTPWSTIVRTGSSIAADVARRI